MQYLKGQSGEIFWIKYFSSDNFSESLWTCLDNIPNIFIFGGVNRILNLLKCTGESKIERQATHIFYAFKFSWWAVGLHAWLICCLIVPLQGVPAIFGLFYMLRNNNTAQLKNIQFY